MRVVILTLDRHRRAACEAAQRRLAREAPGVVLTMHVASEWTEDPQVLAACRADLERADLVVATQLFMEDHLAPVRAHLAAAAERCRAFVGLLAAGEVVRLTHLGRLRMDARDAEGSRFAPGRLLRKLRGQRGDGSASGRRQMAVLRNVDRVLRFVPGKAQDVRAYLRSLQYWLSGSEENLVGLVRFLTDRYGDGTSAGQGPVPEPVRYPETGLYHPDLPGLVEDLEALPARADRQGRVGVLLMRSYLLSGDTAPYDAVIRALEAQGLEVVPAFAAGLDNRPCVERFFVDAEGRSRVDAVVSLTGFSLIGGPAYHDADASRALLTALDVPYVVAQPLEFQTLEDWQDDARGITPMEAALRVALPELDGAILPHVFAGRSREGAGVGRPVEERVERLATRVARWVRLRRTPRDRRRLAVVLFNFPPNAGAVGTAAYLDVFRSLHALLARLRDEGYDVDVPPDVEALRSRLLGGNAERYGTSANVHARVPVDAHVRDLPWLSEIEKVWGPAPGRHLQDGRHLLVQGERFGNVFVGVQPPFGVEGDPMRLLFEGGFAPTHAFVAFYRWLQTELDADAYLHFGTHGAVEFMPGKQAGLSGACWPDRLMGDVPNLYLYAANNPSEGTLAKRRAGATLVSHLTPPVMQAGLYRGLLDLRTTLDRFFTIDPVAQAAERTVLAETAEAQARALDLASDADGEGWDVVRLERLRAQLRELEESLIPHGLHVLGRAPSPEERTDLLDAWMEGTDAGARLPAPERRACADLASGGAPRSALRRRLGEAGLASEDGETLAAGLEDLTRALGSNAELDALVHALDGAFVPPAPGGDVLRRPEILPTGRNLYAFDPYRMPSAAAVREGRLQAERLLARLSDDRGDPPRSLGIVLWGSDNLKRDGAPLAQVLALIGAEPRFDAYGRLCGARLIPLDELGRSRVDVVVTTSGVFRDLLPLQTRLLAEAAWLAASADEPLELNPVRAHALALAEAEGCDLRTAALRVFSNADGAYGANVNLMVDASTWEASDELGASFARRKSFAYGADGTALHRPALFQGLLARVDATYQNLESVELGVSDLDQYVDSLGGLTQAARGAADRGVDAFIGDETRGRGTVRSLAEQVALEARTRTLNPRWYEGMLAHGHQGVREIETRLTTTLGWSATTGDVQPWVYARFGETFVLDATMRARLADLNPHAASRMAQRVLEACDRGYWEPDGETLAALHAAADELEDRSEGIQPEAAA